MEISEIKILTVTISNENGNILIEVNDTGCGIPQENIGRIFTPFFTTKKMGKGTGLGLAISYGIVKMHKGEIKVKSIPGEGTGFTISLPINSNIMNPIMN
jgi:signal transduction histidine kinase